jgi:predicted ATPase
MARLPAGTVTFVFTDIEGTTRLLHELGAAAYADALAEHRRVVREAFAAGAEVDTQGDAFFYAFAKASDALAACEAATTAFDGGPVRIRIGVHTGEPLVTGDGYVGIDVHRAARIAAVGHGGQVVVSQATRDLVPEAALVDLGEHRLKDLARPERLYQLGPGSFPPLRSLNLVTLPLQPTPLIGRRAELDSIVALVEAGARIVTLTGPGGSGKTRLALAAAAELAESFPDGVWFVSLAAVDAPALVPLAVSSVLGTEGPPEQWLRARRALLVVDNVEHLLPEAAVSVGALAAGDGVRIIATSRERLALAAEHELPIDPLPLTDGVELFLTRARQLGVQVELTSAAERVVELVDSLPLAIELAAARTKVMTVADVAERLRTPLDLLRGGPRDAPARQQTLRATIEWSVSLLPDDERTAFIRLAVFRSSFDLAAAERVAEAGVDVVAALVDKNLLRRTDDGRLFMLETLRQFAREVFETTAGREAVEERHALLAVERTPIQADEAADAWRRRIERTYGDVRAALEWLQSHDRHAELVELAVSLAGFWDLRAGAALSAVHGVRNPVEGRHWLEAALAHVPNRSGDDACKILSSLAHFAFRQDDWDAADAWSAETIAAARVVGDSRAESFAHSNRATIAYFRGDAERALGEWEAGLALARAAGDEPLIASMTNDLALLAIEERRWADAELLAAEAVDITHRHGLALSEANALGTLADLRISTGDLAAAGGLASGSLRMLHAGDAPSFALAEALVRLAFLAATDGDAELAARLIGARDGLEELEAVWIEPQSVSLRQRTLDEIERRLGPERTRAALDAGRPLSLDAAVELALSRP